jgi:DNA invertase Pin-like site-specific DNA recombinase
VIDDDLGRSASGTVERPGFDGLVAWLCAGEVGAVLCSGAPRLARNGCDWHHLLELCGHVEACFIDLDGVYNPRRPNYRLLLWMKGTPSSGDRRSSRIRRCPASSLCATSIEPASLVRSGSASLVTGSGHLDRNAPRVVCHS